MKQLNKHKLDFNHAWEYVRDDLDKTNTLSSELLNLVNFKNGYFFSLLPEDANIQEVHNFKSGWILPPNPIEEYFVNGHKATYSIKTSIRNELSQLILKEILSNSSLSCIMDDVSGSTPEDKSHPCFYDNYSIFYDEEVYSLLNKSNISYELVLKCLMFSTSFWHSLCVFTTANFIEGIKILSLEKIKEICLATEMIMVGAYDAEGYVFWEKNLANAGKRFLE